VTDWFNFCRVVCSADLLANPLQIGEPRAIVAIDESVVAKSKPGNAQARPVPRSGSSRGQTVSLWNWSTTVMPPLSFPSFSAISFRVHAYGVTSGQVQRLECHWLRPPDCQSQSTLCGPGHWRSHIQH